MQKISCSCGVTHLVKEENESVIISQQELIEEYKLALEDANKVINKLKERVQECQKKLNEKT